jgi:hypothetical protein
VFSCIVSVPRFQIQRLDVPNRLLRTESDLMRMHTTCCIHDAAADIMHTTPVSLNRQLSFKIVAHIYITVAQYICYIAQ